MTVISSPCQLIPLLIFECRERVSSGHGKNAHHVKILTLGIFTQFD